MIGKPPTEEALMEWAIEQLGVSKCKQIKLVNQSRWKFYGDWNWAGRIRINIAHLKYKYQIYRVLAHEWTHAQQDYREYKKLAQKYTYMEHPLEVEASWRETHWVKYRKKKPK